METTDRAIGAIIADQRELSPEQIERILAYQRERGLRFGEAAIALRCFERIIVLHCPQDRIIAGGLGRSGPAADSDGRVGAADLSPLVECRHDSAYGALCSCESLSLILRLLQGAPLPAALPARTRPATA